LILYNADSYPPSTAMADTGAQRQFPYGKTDGSYNGRSPYGQGIARANYGQAYAMPNGQLNNFLATGLQAMTMQDPNFAPHTRTSPMAANDPHFGQLTLNTGLAASYWPNNGQMIYPNGQAYASNASAHSPAMYSPAAAQYMAHGYAPTDNSPQSQDWTPSQATGDVPTLITTRRDSISSNENDAPGTPSYASYPSFAHGGVAIVNRSPSGTYTSTPSPLQMMTPYGAPMQKTLDLSTISPRLKMLVAKEPAIPPAIPAPSSPLKPLDRALENLRGETNVYIRGLLPETTDDMLENYGRRFGDIKSSKSIIDHGTGLCKGFGFVRYHNYKDAEDCIRGFHHLGYEVSFARESFYSKLKAIADDGNTNLYVSNLPKNMNEHELASIFAPLKVCSARILRLKDGTGRGVGFARFESRADCDEVIRLFNNKTIEANDEDHAIQIRFADTQEQKHLKQQTAAARQFRSAEYEYATQAHKQGWRMQYPQAGKGQVNEFESFLGTAPGVPIQNQRWAQSAWRQASQRSPLAAMPYNTANIRANPSVTQASPASKSQAVSIKDGGVDLKTENVNPATAHGEASPTDSAHESN